MMNLITNLRVINNNIWTAGQPTKEEIKGLKALNFDTVINLAPIDPRYSISDEAGLVESLGMLYVHQPVNFNEPNIQDFTAFERTLNSQQDRRVFIHCAANYRVTVFFGFYAVRNLGWSQTQCEELINSVWNINEYPIWLNFKNELSLLKANFLEVKDPIDTLKNRLYEVISQFILRGKDDQLEKIGKAFLLSKLEKFIASNRPIRFILPGFPCKSPNFVEKSFGVLPDYGEVMAIQQMDRLGNLINEHYSPGCVVTVLSDGTTFNDIVGVSDEDCARYNQQLRSLCCTKNIQWLSLKDIFPAATNSTQLRKELIKHAQLPQETIDDFIQSVRQSNILSASHDKLCGYLYNDFRMLQNPELSKELYLNNISLNAYEMMYRGKALTANISRVFPDDIRLSTHQYNNAGPKFTFRLTDGINTGAPWHAVPVCQLGGSISTQPHSQVDPSCHLMVTHQGHPWLYHETDTEESTQFEYTLLKRPSFGLMISNPKNLDPSHLSNQLLNALIRKFGFVCIRKFNFPDQDKFTDFCRSFGEIYLWDFGAVHVVKPEDKPHGFVHSLEKTPLHWDLSMLPLSHASVQVNEFFCANKFMLYCDKPPQAGEGQTTIVDGRNVLQLAGHRKVKEWAKIDITYSTKKTYFGGHPRTYPLIQNHPDTGELIFRYQEGSTSDLQTFNLNIKDMSEQEETAIINDINSIVYSEECMIAHEWEKDDLLLVDNYLMLHGRLPMTEKSKARELWRVQTCSPTEKNHMIKKTESLAI